MSARDTHSSAWPIYWSGLTILMKCSWSEAGKTPPGTTTRSWQASEQDTTRCSHVSSKPAGHLQGMGLDAGLSHGGPQQHATACLCHWLGAFQLGVKGCHQHWDHLASRELLKPFDEADIKKDRLVMEGSWGRWLWQGAGWVIGPWQFGRIKI